MRGKNHVGKGYTRDSNPTSLNYTIFYTISQQFGTRGHQEHHQICIEDQKIVKKAGTGEPEYITEWVEGLTKTRQGGLSMKERRVPQRMFAWFVLRENWYLEDLQL